jgi:hypothetical protein
VWGASWYEAHVPAIAMEEAMELATDLHRISAPNKCLIYLSLLCGAKFLNSAQVAPLF